MTKPAKEKTAAQTPLESVVDIPEGVTVDIKGQTITVSAKAGSTSKDFLSKLVTITQKDNTVVFASTKSTKRERRIHGTFKALLNAMFIGVTDGHNYKLKICSGHFPMKVAVKGTEFVVENFLGEKVPRKLSIKDGVKVNVSGDIVEVTGADKETVGQVAGAIEKLARSKNDLRIFQDGIYITHKNERSY